MRFQGCFGRICCLIGTGGCGDPQTGLDRPEACSCRHRSYIAVIRPPIIEVEGVMADEDKSGSGINPRNEDGRRMAARRFCRQGNPHGMHKQAGVNDRVALIFPRLVSGREGIDRRDWPMMTYGCQSPRHQCL